MFLEPGLSPANKVGWIEVICGCMFSGKTEELLRRVNRAKLANLKAQLFKPSIDKRFHDTHVVSHDSRSAASLAAGSSTFILKEAGDAQVVGIDEAQFFDDKLVNTCDSLASKGIRVIVAGLDMDYRGKPFGPMPAIMAIAEYVTKVNAVCMVCGELATHTFRKSRDESLILLGEKDLYEARCRKCFNEGM